METSSAASIVALDVVERPRVAALLARVRRRGAWIAAALAAAAAAGGFAYLQTWPPLAIVESGSMTPTIRTGDVVLLQRLGRAPRVGDVVAVTVPDAARSRYGYPPEVIHRVVRIAPNGDLTTKGDALKTADPFTTRHGTVSSRVVATIPAAGRALAFLTSTLGMVWLAAGALLLIAMPQLDRRRDRDERERESIAGLHEKLETVSGELARLRSEAGAESYALDRRLATLIRESDETQRRLAAAVAALDEAGRRPLPGAPGGDPIAPAADEEGWPLVAPRWDSDCRRTPRGRRRGGWLRSPFWSEDAADIFPAADARQSPAWPPAAPSWQQDCERAAVERRSGGTLPSPFWNEDFAYASLTC